MTAFVDFLQRFVDTSRFRHHLNRRRRLVAAILAGAGAFLLITALRSPAPVLDGGLSPRLDIAPGEVAVPVVIRPSGALSTLASGMQVTLVGQDASRIHSVRVVDVPTSGFGASPESIAVVALSEQDALVLASRPSQPMGVVIHSHDDRSMNHDQGIQDIHQ